MNGVGLRFRVRVRVSLGLGCCCSVSGMYCGVCDLDPIFLYRPVGLGIRNRYIGQSELCIFVLTDQQLLWFYAVS